MSLYQKPNWVRWGLSCLNDTETIARNEHNHDLIANYLDQHPEAHDEWKKGFNYTDILVLAAAEGN